MDAEGCQYTASSFAAEALALALALRVDDRPRRQIHHPPGKSCEQTRRRKTCKNTMTKTPEMKNPPQKRWQIDTSKSPAANPSDRLR